MLPLGLGLGLGWSLGTTPDGGPGNIVPVITASRTSGFGPLSITFSAKQTTDSSTTAAGLSTFRHLHYEWDFGDPSSGTWAYGAAGGGQSKNVEHGPVVTHVFEPAPGTGIKDFVVRLKVRNIFGNEATTTMLVTVTDEDTYFGTVNTTYVNPVGDADFSAAYFQTGATYINSNDYWTITQAITNGKRILFKGGVGNTYTVASNNRLNTKTNILIGSYNGQPVRVTASGAPAALVELCTIQNTSATNKNQNPVIRDMHWIGSGFTNGVNGGMSSSVPTFEADTTHGNVLFLRTEYTDCKGGMISSAGYGLSLIDFKINPVTNNGGSTYVGFSGGNGAYIGLSSMCAIAGGFIDNGKAGEHNIRFNGVRESFVGHLKLARPAPTKHNLTPRGVPSGFSGTITTINGSKVFSAFSTNKTGSQLIEGQVVTCANYPAGTVIETLTAFDAGTMSNPATAGGTLVAATGTMEARCGWLNIQDIELDLSDSPANWPIATTFPGADLSFTQYLEELVFDRIHFNAPSATGVFNVFNINNPKVSIRNVAGNLTGVNASSLALVGFSHEVVSYTAAAPDDVDVNNVSVYSSATGKNISLMTQTTGSDATNVKLRNALFYAPGAGNHNFGGAGSQATLSYVAAGQVAPIIENCSSDSQVLSTDPLWVNAGGSMALATDFKLQAGSYARGSGIDGIPVFIDVLGTTRNRADMDIGASDKTS